MSSLLASLRRALDALRFAPPLLARVILGLVFVPSGWAKLHDLPALVDFFTQLGIPFPSIQAPFVATVELVCGSLVLVGLAARPAAAMLVATMAVAILTAVWPGADGVLDFVTKPEPLYLTMLAYLVVYGAGAVSLDAVVWRRLAPATSVAAFAHS
jgi:putative oxidoreductase